MICMQKLENILSFIFCFIASLLKEMKALVTKGFISLIDVKNLDCNDQKGQAFDRDNFNFLDNKLWIDRYKFRFGKVGQVGQK